MPAFTADQITAMQGAIAGLLFDTPCTILRLTELVDTGGTGATEQRYVPLTTVNGQITGVGKSRPATEEAVIALAERNITLYTLTLPYGTDLRPRDRVTTSGASFEVIGTDGADSLPLTITALVKEIA